MIFNAVQQTANFCYTRQAFGKPLLDNQTIHFRLAELLTEAELLRSLVYRATGESLFYIFIFNKSLPTLES